MPLTLPKAGVASVPARAFVVDAATASVPPLAPARVWAFTV
jgi:hypothetical protein